MSNYWDELMATDEGAANYMESYGEGPGCETRQIIAGYIQDGETVLDVGCGPGWNLDHFWEFGPLISDYKGIDYSERFVRIANKRANKGLDDDYQDLLRASSFTPSSGPHFVVGDCRDFQEPDESWDVVILQDVLEHTNGYEIPVREALRVAKQRVIVSFWKGSFKDDADSEDQINDDGNDGYGATYNRAKWENFLEGLGYIWWPTETSPKANRWHKFYIIPKIKKIKARSTDE